MLSADWLIELGPGAGEHGGRIVAEGPVEVFMRSDCSTARYLSGQDEIEIPPSRREPAAPCPISVR
jgi:excinuclease ABC subunit A